LGEWGIEVLEAYPKPVTADVLRASDVIVTMGCGDACPILSGKRYLGWEIPDPRRGGICPSCGLSGTTPTPGYAT
jgi:protein-tyrosine-phosphatase